MDDLPFVHPHLSIQSNPAKGRMVVATAPIKDGQVLMMDRPYTLVPALLTDDPPFQLCSNHQCHGRIPAKSPGLVACEKNCVSEVVWCNEACRRADAARHELECAWLKEISTDLRQMHGDSNFGLFWMMARIMVVKFLQSKTDAASTTKSSSHFERRGWDAVWSLEGDTTSFPAEQVSLWRGMARNYLVHELLPVEASLEDFVTLICKVETNSFGLYPGETGEYPIESYVSRGEYYGGGVYPTAAMFNHACCPNITHQVDESSVRIFKAGRDIQPGEECCITYFDLVEFLDADARKEEVSKSWSFVCNCRRCADDNDYEIPHFLQELGLGLS